MTPDVFLSSRKGISLIVSFAIQLMLITQMYVFASSFNFLTRQIKREIKIVNILIQGFALQAFFRVFIL